MSRLRTDHLLLRAVLRPIGQGNLQILSLAVPAYVHGDGVAGLLRVEIGGDVFHLANLVPVYRQDNVTAAWNGPAVGLCARRPLESRLRSRTVSRDLHHVDTLGGDIQLTGQSRCHLCARDAEPRVGDRLARFHVGKRSLGGVAWYGEP